MYVDYAERAKMILRVRKPGLNALCVVDVMKRAVLGLLVLVIHYGIAVFVRAFSCLY